MSLATAAASGSVMASASSFAMLNLRTPSGHVHASQYCTHAARPPSLV